MKAIPPALRNCGFTRAEAARQQVTSRMLEGKRFTRVFPGVWRCTSDELTWEQEVAAARLAIPEGARLTGISRIQRLGLDFGPRHPLRFVVEGDHHLDIDGVFLHRTKKLAPHDGHDVSAAAAYLSYCHHARIIDAVKVGDWLLHHRKTSKTEIEALALAALWRDGALEALWILDHLDERSRSLMESECRAVLRFAGLPEPEVNVAVPLDEQITVIADLYYVLWRLAVEYEGTQHQTDRDQYVADLDRYAIYRASDIAYVHVTKEKIRHARTLVGEVYRALVARGYTGPPPTFGHEWTSLFLGLSLIAGSKREWLLARARREVS